MYNFSTKNCDGRNSVFYFNCIFPWMDMTSNSRCSAVSIYTISFSCVDYFNVYVSTNDFVRLI